VVTVSDRTNGTTCQPKKTAPPTLVRWQIWTELPFDHQ